jgi:hypothetical protein
MPDPKTETTNVTQLSKVQRKTLRKACLNKIAYRKPERANGVKKLGHTIYQCRFCPFWHTTSKPVAP